MSHNYYRSYTFIIQCQYIPQRFVIMLINSADLPELAYNESHHGIRFVTVAGLVITAEWPLRAGKVRMHSQSEKSLLLL